MNQYSDHTVEITAEKIIEKIEASYGHLLALYQGVPPVALLTPALHDGWSVKDTLAHIAAWDHRCAVMLSEAHYSDGPLKANPAVDALNQEFYRERQDWDWAQVETEFQHAHRALLAVIRQLPRERLNEPFVQQAIAEETWQHYAQHLVELEAWRKQSL